MPLSFIHKFLDWDGRRGQQTECRYGFTEPCIGGISGGKPLMRFHGLQFVTATKEPFTQLHSYMTTSSWLAERISESFNPEGFNVSASNHISSVACAIFFNAKIRHRSFRRISLSSIRTFELSVFLTVRSFFPLLAG